MFSKRQCCLAWNQPTNLTEQALEPQLVATARHITTPVRSQDFMNPNGPWFQLGTATLVLRRNTLGHFLRIGGGSAQTEPI